MLSFFPIYVSYGIPARFVPRSYLVRLRRCHDVGPGDRSGDNGLQSNKPSANSRVGDESGCFHIRSQCDADREVPTRHDAEPKPTTSASNRLTPMSELPMASCRICNRRHPLYKCSVFRKMSLEKRLRTVAYNRYCYNCLRPDHLSKNCPVRLSCRHCTERHHSLLHKTRGNRSKKNSRAVRNNPTSVVPRGIFPPPPPHVIPVSVLPMGRLLSLSPTVLVRLCLPHSTIPVRALLDPCCSISQVCASLVHQLRWPTTKVNELEYADLLIISRFDSVQRHFVTASVANITRGVTPSVSISPAIRESFVGLELADPAFDKAGPIAMVLGPEIYSKIISPRVIAQPGLPTAQYTTFGWVLSGPVPL